MENFSPLFIGEITSTPPGGLTTPTLLYFSPLFIGEITSTGRLPICALAEGLHISVPSSSGKSLQPFPGLLNVVRRGIISVPSSSGKSLQRRGCLAHNLSHFLFQSPLHRGNHFNDQLYRIDAIGAEISVPSSSGKSLQH